MYQSLNLLDREIALMCINNNAVCPSWVRSPMVEAECKKSPNREGALKAMSRLSPGPELEEIAEATISLPRLTPKVLDANFSALKVPIIRITPPLGRLPEQCAYIVGNTS